MPPFIRHIDEEGVLFDDFHLVEEGRFRLDADRCPAEIRPAPGEKSAPEHRRPPGPGGGLRQGRRRLERMVAQFGLETVEAYMRHVMDNGRGERAAVIDRRSRTASFTYPHDRGPVIEVKVTRPTEGPIRQDRLHRHEPAAGQNFTHSSGRRHPCQPSSTSSEPWSTTTSP
jgi:5-oxoprolinase (ATP-hydrolysing)